jgi:hypothetical protein
MTTARQTGDSTPQDRSASPTDYRPFQPATEGIPEDRDATALEAIPLVAVERRRARNQIETAPAARGHGWPHRDEPVSAAVNEQFCAAMRAVKNAAELRGVPADTHIGRMLVDPDTRAVVAVGLTAEDCPDGQDPLALPGVDPEPEAVPRAYGGG